MESLTRRRLGAAELAAMVHRGFGESARIATWRELTAGGRTATYAVTLDDGQDLALKVSPPPGGPLLTHELDLMRTEVEVYAHCAAAGVPAPAVVYADFRRTLLDSDYAFLSRVPGQPLDQVAKAMTPAQLAAARRQSAALAARLHRITGTGYGYPRRSSDTWSPSWRAAFGAMVADLVDDARRMSAPLPAPPERIGALLRRHAGALDDVRRPALVHFDLGDENVLVSRGPADGPGAGWQVCGLVDAERSFYGDPIADLVPLTLPRDLDDAPEVLDGFAAGTGRPLELTGRVRRRFSLYRAYLYMIMAIERGSPARRDSGQRDSGRVLGPLDRELALLAVGPAGR